MLRRLASLATIFLAVTVLATPGFAQDKGPRPSPSAKTTCSLPDGKSITVDYSSPRAKGRKIYGGLVPYGEVWRAGANEATTFVADTDVVVGGKTVAAGTYTILPFRMKTNGRSSSARKRKMPKAARCGEFLILVKVTTWRAWI